MVHRSRSTQQFEGIKPIALNHRGNPPNQKYLSRQLSKHQTGTLPSSLTDILKPAAKSLQTSTSNGKKSTKKRDMADLAPLVLPQVKTPSKLPTTPVERYFDKLDNKLESIHRDSSSDENGETDKVRRGDEVSEEYQVLGGIRNMLKKKNGSKHRNNP